VVTPFSSREKDALLAQLEMMRIEPEGVDRTFVARLAKENAWAPVYAERVLAEYRRFLFLAVTSGHAVTPSDEVDQAWHLHLAYSHHYWEELCGRILGRPLHHGPTAGGRTEAARYRNQYAATLESYRLAFGIDAPGDIWPPERERFAGRYERVDRSRHWVIPKLPWRIALASSLIAGCAVGSDGNGGSKIMGLLIALSLLGLIIVAMIYIAHRRSHRVDREGCGGAPGCGSSKGRDSGCGHDGGCGGGGCGGGGCGGGGCGGS